jgi:hypothetical protein
MRSSKLSSGPSRVMHRRLFRSMFRYLGFGTYRNLARRFAWRRSWGSTLRRFHLAGEWRTAFAIVGPHMPLTSEPPR